MHRHSQSFLRAIIRTVWLPVVSFVLVVAVAMGCAVWSPINKDWGVTASMPLRINEIPMELHRYEIEADASWQHIGIGVSFYDVALKRSGPGMNIGGRQTNVMTLGRAGFPFRCLRFVDDRRGDSGSASVWIRGLETERTYSRFGAAYGSFKGVRHVPFMPEPVGMLLNVLIYSAVIALPRYVWRRAVVFRRTRKNLCVKCGYPIGDFAVCPECGESIESS